MDGKDLRRIDHIFGYHPPRSQARVEDHEFIRGELRRAAKILCMTVPRGPEQETMLERLREAMFWANAALALAPDPDASVPAEQAAAGPLPRGGEGTA